MANDEIRIALQIKSALEELGQYLTIELQKELSAQGHKASGKLIESVGYTIEGIKGGLELQISYLDYGRVVETGVPANRIPFGGGTGGGGTSKYIQGLLNWIKTKRFRLSPKKALSFAFAIANAHRFDGMPTKGSFAYSSNGRRTGFQSQVLEDNQEYIVKKIQEGAEFSVETLVTDLVNATLQKL